MKVMHACKRGGESFVYLTVDNEQKQKKYCCLFPLSIFFFFRYAASYMAHGRLPY